jgi:hypothetical protein
MVQWAVQAIHETTLSNILILALLVVIATPAFFAWRFITDPAFRHEFLSGAQILDASVPCLVLVGNIAGRSDRTLVANSYDSRNRIEYLIVLRADNVLTNGALANVCNATHEEVGLIRWAKREKERAGPRPGPQ